MEKIMKQKDLDTVRRIIKKCNDKERGYDATLIYLAVFDLLKKLHMEKFEAKLLFEKSKPVALDMELK